MDKENNNSLTSFQFEPKDNRTSEEGVLSKILDKVKSAVSGQPTSWTHDNASMHSTHSERRISNSTEPSVISIPHTVSNVIAVTEYPNSSSNSSTASQRLPKDSVLANFPVSSDSLSKSSTIATTATTVIVGKHGKLPEDMIIEPAHSNSTVQFIMPSTSNNNNRKSLEENSVDLLPLYTRKSIDSDTQSVATNFSISNSNSLGRILARLRGQKNDKEFWMPDEQCKECYKCRKPFTLLRRKHHCRTCGQIFCGKCASHIVSGKLYKQKGQVRVCNFCYKKQQQQLQEKSISSTTEPIMHFKTVSSPLSRQIITDNNSEETSQLTLLDQAEQYGSEIIPSQKPPLAVPNMQIPTAALKQARGAYGNENTTTFALEIPIYGSESYSSSQLERPHSPFVAMAEQPTSPTLCNTSTITNTPSFNVTNTPDNHIYTGVKRLLDAGTSFIKPRPRSNTSSSAPLLEDFRSTQLPFRSVPYLDHGGGTVLAESELSSFPSAVVDPDEQYEDEAAALYDRPLTPLKAPLYSDKPNSSNSDPLSPATNGGISDDESYDHRLRAKRTEELRGKNVQLISSKSSYHSYRRLSITGPTTPKLRNSGLHKINTVGLPKYDYPPSSAGPLQLEQTWSPNPLLSPYNDDANKFFPQSDNNNRFRFVPRQRRTSGPPPTVELSLSARQHARMLLRQFMQDIQFTESSKEEWEDVIMNILMKVANNVQPDTRAGDDMDVRHYVKIKKIPGGLPSDSFYVKGVVCTKNVAHKRMVRNMSSPRILILLFSLDYSRVEMENQLLSITPVISQEREHISKLVGRIVALKPSLLLVKSTVSRFALEFLLKANIPVIHNVKHSVIEAVARCTEAAIVTSVDKLQHGVSFGRCGSFEIRTFMHEWIPNRRKTYLIFDDCSPELGGTIVLRGEKVETLKVIKRLIDFMVFVVNNLKYETSLLRDSFAKNRGASESEERKRSPLMRQSSLGIEKLHDLEDDGHNYTDLLLQTYQNTILSVSQFVVFKPPYLLLKLKETEERLAMVIQQKRKKSISCLSILKDAASTVSTPAVLSLSVSPTRTTFDKQARSPMEKQQSMSHPASTSSYDTQEGDEFTSEFEQELITKSHQIARAWEAYHGETPESISPFYHQNIVVLYSSVCTVTTVPCQGPEIRIFGYYRIPSDKTLGQYIMDLCADAHQPCTSFMCDHPMLQHYRSYAHGNARVNVMIEQFPCPLPGMSDKLLMWSYCRECNKPTPVLPMSENTWNYSFGKFLEIFLYQEGVHCRADICPHDMARNHVRYFGYMDMTVRFQYDPIELLEVSVPPMKLYIKSKIQRDLKEAELKSLRTKINRFYQSIVDRNKAFPFDLVDPRKLEACKAELQELSLEAQGEKKDTLQLLQNLRVSGSLSAAYTPSRIPLYSGKNNSPLLVYQQSSKQATTSTNESKTAYKATVGPSSLSHVSSIERLPRFPPHRRHHSIAHDYHIHQRYGKSMATSSFDDNDEFEPSPSFLRRSATSKDRRFRSRLPRKKTYIQVYDQANDLVREDIDDEFYPGDQADDTLSISSRQAAHRLKTDILLPRRKPTSYRQARHQRRLQLGYHAHESGTDADNDDDSDDEAEETFDVGKSNIDYFTPIAPFTFEVLDEPKTDNKLEVENTQDKSDDGSTTNYADVKPYFGLSDGQVDLMSGISGDDETDQDFLPLASDLLMAQQSANDALAISDLHNIHPELTTATTNTSSSIRYITATANDENRHSPEKMSFMKTITNFLTDSGIGNLLPLESPLQPTEYLFPDSYVVVREDEPSTIIAYTLSSEDYLDKMHDIQNCHSESGMNDTNLKAYDSINIDQKAPSENYTFESGLHNNTPQAAEAIQETLLRESGSHMRYNFSQGSTKFFCKIFFSEQFDALRRNCGCDESYIMSLASCIKWDSSGGKSGSAFLKTKDDRLLMKQMSRYELDAFLGFAPAYFQYMSEAFFSELPTALAKIFGFYSIGYKNSMIYQSPLFIRAHSKEILRSSLHNDTLFLSNRNVMDYSLLVGIDADRQELVVGIVDFIRTFTWDKKLESWVKESGILGGGGKEPTIVSPRQYRIRFREAMERYFLMVPDFWALTRQNRALYTVLHHHTTSHQAATSSNDENA
ncbi:hypothetical protein RMCBS344292_01322 [Rhizopus microsporus]|nr:hypothetical protein RMCBS344292_01322 [Rhizopus microsporus]